MISRRKFITSASALALSTSLVPSFGFAQTPGQKRLVIIILRGGMDGLAALPPYADPDYHSIRGALALKTEKLLRIDSLFALHPSLSFFEKLYRAGDMIAIPASASPYRERSHFDGQNVLEQGTKQPNTVDTGWLNRMIDTLQTSADATLAFGQGIPHILRGPHSVGSWSPSGLPEPSEQYLDLVQRIYAQDARFADHLQQALQLESMDMSSSPKTHARQLRSQRSSQQFLTLASTAGHWLSQAQGPRIATLELGGWDTHARQGTENGRLANNFRLFAKGIESLQQELGTAWKNTVVAAITEFGRTARPNGNMGTDHGTASTAFLFGGALLGGRIIHQWPGLKPSQLHENRDVRPTIDLRAIMKGIMHEHFHIPESTLANIIYPDSSTIDPVRGLIRNAQRGVSLQPDGHS